MPKADSLIGQATATAHPNLAIIKYWGKESNLDNTPASPSLGIALDELHTVTTVYLTTAKSENDEADKVLIDGKLQLGRRFADFFANFRKLVGEKRMGKFTITAHSSSNFPSSAGFASSASGFAALALACTSAVKLELPAKKLSALARTGSASAARSTFGGFVHLDSGASYANQVHDETWWPELRIIVVEIEGGIKKISSRAAMERAKMSSPFYQAWISDSKRNMDKSLSALEARNLSALGPLIRQSYLRMFSTMFSSYPPIIYWKPASLAVIDFCERLRSAGLNIWETMDAGPQVKILCLEENVPLLIKRLRKQFPNLPFRICKVGGAAYLND